MSNHSWFGVRVKYYARRYRRVIIAFTLIAIVFNLSTHFFNAPVIRFDESYQGTFKGKYLSTIKNVNFLKTDEFYKKWSLIGYLDDLVNEPIEEPSFHNSKDPFEIIESIENEKKVQFVELAPLEKAKLYSESVLPKSKFQFKVIQDIIYKDAFFAKKFINNRLKKWLKLKQYLTEDEKKLLGVDDDWFRQAVIDLKQKKLDHNMVSSQEIKNTLSHMKIFSSIFLKPGSDNLFRNEETLEDATHYCSSISKKLFNFLSGDYPIISQYDNQNKVTRVPYALDDNLQDDCFLKSLQMNSMGKGIVVTAADHLVPELSGLLALLRVTGNTYPIQIFHKQDLSLESIKILTEIALDPILRLPQEVKEFKVPHNLDTLNLHFVDVSEVLKPRFRKYYSGFSMKLLAYLFNTFEEVIMLDTDTIILENINRFFDLQEYIDRNAFFFRDRDVNSFLYEGIIDYFKSYLNYDQEVHFLNFPRVSEETLNNRFFGAYARHFVEAGLFVINKREKFDGVVTSFMLQMFKLFSGSLHGEKEFIWLGQEYMGNDYSLNENPAVAVGELTPNRDNESNELCTTHPAHLYKDMELLWFNSGFLNCKKFESYYKDINYERNKGKTLLELKKEYLSPLHITHALMPPPAEYAAKGADGEPVRGWTMTQQCSNYLWCAYDVIGGVNNNLIPKGMVISFRPEDTNKWDFLGQLWVRYFNRGYNTGDRGYIEGDAYDELGLDKIDVFTGESKEDLDDSDIDVPPKAPSNVDFEEDKSGEIERIKVPKRPISNINKDVEDEIEENIEDTEKEGEQEQENDTPKKAKGVANNAPGRAKGVNMKADKEKLLDGEASREKAVEILGENEDDEGVDQIQDDETGIVKDVKEDYDGY
ncbi:hypothetical protein CANINC_004809 [Pichia inconspicua]|uniref:Glycosyltransferase family 71 protein n=1 Tax=Pichia inconspicua TaxID=52247 RepID=A0A4T0WV55_9ASCO|nr:hypothetical protein CANINC_004809 [[Candida] inconspicua]